MDPATELAEYFTGSNVAAASIGLQLGGHAKIMADAFFRMREVLGIRGYASRNEALHSIRATLSDSSVPLNPER